MNLSPVFLLVVVTFVGLETLPSALGGGGACPKFTPVPVDEKWFLASRSGGFKSQLARGTSKEDLDYTPKPPAPVTPKGKVKKLCWRANALFNGKDLGPTPGMQCEYENVNEQCCKIANPKAAKLAKDLFGISTPSSVRSTIVATDNKTYAAVGACIDGVKSCWTILSVDGKAKLDKKVLAGALHISEGELSKAEKSPKPFLPGPTTVTPGECPPDSTPRIMPETLMQLKNYFKG